MTGRDDQAEVNVDLGYYVYLRDSHTEATRSYDKTVLTLAGGALGLSITFLGDIVGPSPKSTGFVIAGWLLLASALVSVAVSFLTSERLFWHAMHESLDAVSRWNSVTGWLNVGAGVFLAAGLGSLAVFAYLNL